LTGSRALASQVADWCIEHSGDIAGADLIESLARDLMHRADVPWPIIANGIAMLVIESGL
jgi:hypothetical protein